MTDFAWREPIKVLADVIASEMGLDTGHIMLGFQSWGIPQDDGLYVALTTLSEKPVGNNNYFDGGDPDADPPVVPAEIQEVVTSELIQIDVMSFDGSVLGARGRKNEVLMALASMASLTAQAQFNMRIHAIPTGFQNVSSLEETKFLNRFTVTLIVQSVQRKTKDAAYFDTFQTVQETFNA